jgi:hypothetical protein
MHVRTVRPMIDRVTVGLHLVDTEILGHALGEFSWMTACRHRPRFLGEVVRLLWCMTAQ